MRPVPGAFPFFRYLGELFFTLLMILIWVWIAYFLCEAGTLQVSFDRYFLDLKLSNSQLAEAREGRIVFKSYFIDFPAVHTQSHLSGLTNQNRRR